MAFQTSHSVLGNLLAMHPPLSLLLLVAAGRHGLHTPASALFYAAEESLAVSLSGKLWVTCNDASRWGL